MKDLDIEVNCHLDTWLIGISFNVGYGGCYKYFRLFLGPFSMQVTWENNR